MDFRNPTPSLLAFIMLGVATKVSAFQLRVATKVSTMLVATRLGVATKVSFPSCNHVEVHSTDLRNEFFFFLTATTLIYAIGPGITAAAGTRLALQLILVKGFKLYSLHLRDLLRPRTVISCHYLPVWDWVIFVPAAFLRCGSRFSGSLSEIEP